MIVTEDIDRSITNLTKEIDRLSLSIEDTKLEVRIRKEKIDAESKQREHFDKRRETLKNLKGTLSKDERGPFISVGDTIEIVNAYTRFSTWERVKSVPNLIKAKRVIGGRSCEADKFGVVYKVQEATHSGKIITKAFFTTDSGKDTWRKVDNVKVHHEQRGIRCHERQRQQCEFAE